MVRVFVGVQLVVFAGVVSGEVSRPELSGGTTTVFVEGRNAFATPLANISRATRRLHVVGNSFFNQNWVAAPASTVARDGLGPMFQARSCSACHFKDGRGRPPEGDEEMVSMLVRLSIAGTDASGGPLGHPVYGGQLNEHAIPGVKAEGRTTVCYEEEVGEFGDGGEYRLQRPVYTFDWAYGEVGDGLMFSPRVAPPVHGLGLLEAVAEEVVRAGADPGDSDGDGISGRVNEVWDVAVAGKRLGRFGWKAGQPSLRQQSARAFNGDIGITSAWFADENHSGVQGQQMVGLPESEQPEISEKLLDRVEVYMQTLAPPARRDVDDPEVVKGALLFEGLRCVACHVEEMRTAEEGVLEELAGQTIRPYSDLLLHDMGEGLADGRAEFMADGREWRTPPLWGIGLTEVVNGHTRFLHDGRARSLEEAVLWHGGEAEAARDGFRALGVAERAALVRFLESL
ncbi:MAG: di-heme oxidoredictase family protein [Verrucomicrobiales bacterium]|nr:di-heme oxidoredictase family protein [Verrucomicrobiales bacterium]